MKRRQQAIQLCLSVLLFKISSVLCEIKLTTEWNRSVCVFSGNVHKSDLKKYSITTIDGLSCDGIGTDDKCVALLKKKQVITGSCELSQSGNSFESVCFVNRSSITNECCQLEEFKDCSNDKTCLPLADAIGSELSTTYDYTPYATGNYSSGTKATFSCPKDRDLVGKKSSTCKKRVFHPAPPSCEKGWRTSVTDFAVSFAFTIPVFAIIIWFCIRYKNVIIHWLQFPKNLYHYGQLFYNRALE